MEQKEALNFLNDLIKITEEMSQEALLELERKRGVNHEEIQQNYLNSEIKIVDSASDLYYVDNQSVIAFISEVQIDYSYKSKCLINPWNGGRTQVLKNINFANA